MQFQWCYSNNGISYRHVPASYEASAGEVLFSGDEPAPTSEQLTAAFSGYVAAVNAAAGQIAYAVALVAGCAIQSTGTPSLDATYPITSQYEDYYAGLQAGIGATPPAPWLGYLRDINNNKITMTAPQATEVMEGLLGYIEELQASLANSLGGEAWAAPTTPVIIA